MIVSVELGCLTSKEVNKESKTLVPLGKVNSSENLISKTVSSLA